ncbi:hypothetical protein APZ19_20615 [Vibrio owensii]|uniref:Uncharacterized protein n=1 Tax=Vibrio owensii TaxID=696485 RepID=A0AAP9GG00_9VIBR|nr:hypothetical protein APZ19_20615 [Vibrio owensii]
MGNVDGSNAASLQIAGTSTRFEGQTVSVEIKAQGSETAIVSSNATVQSGGALDEQRDGHQWRAKWHLQRGGDGDQRIQRRGHRNEHLNAIAGIANLDQ